MGKKYKKCSRCIKCGNHKNKNGVCEACLAKEEVAATCTDTLFFPRRAYRGRISRNIESGLLNRVLFGLVGLCIITAIICFSAYKYKVNAVNMLDKILPQNQTSAYVLGQYKTINELQVYKINLADYYHYEDGNRNADLIIRYYVNVFFDLNNIKVIHNSNKTVDIVIKNPEIKSNVLSDTKYTKDKAPEDYPGIEIFDSSNDIFNPGYDFKIGEIEDIANVYINKELEKNKSEYEEKAFTNLKVKLKSFLDKLGLEISDIKLDGGTK